MHKIIHENFELDLTPYGVSTVEENYWFSDQFFTKYSFPGTLMLEGELLKFFGSLLDDNSKFIDTEFDVLYVFGNQIEPAIFQIISHIGKRVKFKFRYGTDELPNFNKKLSELPLEETEINNVYTHAKTILAQKWPAVNYNYPQIYTDKYDTEKPTWSEFRGKLNNYVNGDFLVNTYTNDDFSNRNILQPLPYLLHLLKAGFNDAGLQLAGDILTNETAKKTLIYTDINYFVEIENQEAILTTRIDYDSISGDDLLYAETISLRPNSDYKITGKIHSYSTFIGPNFYNWSHSFASILYKGTSLDATGTVQEGSSEKEVEVMFSTDSDTNTQTQVLELSAKSFNFLNYPEQPIFDIKVERVLENSPNEILPIHKVKLTEVVPDVTFGKLVTETRKWLNLDVKKQGSLIYFNFIDNSINYDNAVNLSDYEVLEPLKKATTLDAFLLKFKEPSNDSVVYDKIIHTKSSISTDESLKTARTETIEVDILPLPQKNFLLVESAYAFDLGGKSKIYAVLYDGLQNNLNLTVSPEEILIPAIHTNFYKNWFHFRLNAVLYNWVFKIYQEKLSTIKKKFFAYKRFHILKTLEKTEISKDLFEVEIESETLP